MKKKRIAIIGLKGLPAFGGASRVGECLIDELKNEYDFTVYSIDSHTELKTGNFNGYYQHVFKRLKNNKLNVFLYYIRSALHCLFRGNYDMVHIHHVECGYIAPLLRLRYKVIGTAHGGGRNVEQEQDKWSKGDKRLFKIFVYLFLKFCSVVVTVSAPHIPTYQRVTRKKIIHIPNGIYPNEAFEMPENKDYIFFAAARIISIKGCHTLLAALDGLNYKGKVLIAGDLDQVAVYKERLLTLSKNLDIEFLGLIKQKSTLMGYLKGARLFVFPSVMEAMSNMLLETASMKTPIVCSDIPENKAIFDDEEVLFFETENVADLQSQLGWALDHKEEMNQMADRAFEKLERTYLWKDIAQAYDKIYQNPAAEKVKRK